MMNALDVNSGAFLFALLIFQRTENMRHGLPAAIDENKAQTPLMHADHPDAILV